ncbi:MAG: PilW family protein [Patescibacteria group bacterium]
MKIISYNKKNNNSQGFSLIEVIVSVTLFVLIIMSTTEIFRLVIVGQRKAIASQNVQESLKYFLEATSKEIRMAKKKEGFCVAYSIFQSLPNDQIYAVVDAPNSNGKALIFRNFYDECVVYYLGSNDLSGRFIVVRDDLEAPISPLKVNISELKLALREYNFGLTNHQSRPLVIMKIFAQAYTGEIGTETYRELADINMQTALTSRFYR